MRKSPGSLLAVLAGGMVPTAAWSHIGLAANDLYNGMLHPVLHLPTLLPIVVLALWLSQHKGGHLAPLVTAYMFWGIAGAAVAWFQPDVPRASEMLLPLAVLLGILVAVKQAPPLWISAPLVALVGWVEGFENVVEIAADLSDPLLYLAGLLLTLGLIPMHVTALLHGRRQLWIRTAARILGSWVATVAALVLALEWSGALASP
ncbi:MAG: HupE/UreJ family protein [Pseudomonadota bacterium]